MKSFRVNYRGLIDDVSASDDLMARVLFMTTYRVPFNEAINVRAVAN